MSQVIKFFLLLNIFCFRFDYEKFLSVIQDVKLGISERLRQWSEYEAQVYFSYSDLHLNFSVNKENNYFFVKVMKKFNGRDTVRK